MLEAGRLPNGEIVIEDTGDPKVERWERQIAKGETPDLYEGLSETARARIEEDALFRQRAMAARASLLAEDMVPGASVEPEPSQAPPVQGWAEAVEAVRGGDG